MRPPAKFARLPVPLAVAVVLAARVATAQVDGGAPPDGAPAPSDAAPSPADAAPAPPPAPEPTPPPPATPAPAPPVPARPPSRWVTPQVDVVGRGPRALDHVPGTATVLQKEELRQIAPQSGGEALRTVTGINVVSEDPMGLRLNVGIRGLDPNRSRKVLVLEDGMPVSLNPYGGPEMYYTPPIERMERVEVVKGSGQILWGPQTIGGVINYITRDPPKKLSANADLRYGSFGYLLAQAGAGNTQGPIGWRVDVIHRRFDGPRALDLALTDVAGKLRLRLAPSSTLTVKLDLYDESSRATYLGLTTPQFEANPSLSLATNDRFLVRRYALGITHQHLFSDKLLLQTVAYAYETQRDWRRQDYDRSALGGVTYDRVCDGMGRCGAPGDPGITADNTGGSIFFRSTTAQRNRQYAVAGIEPRVTWSWATSQNLSGELTALARFHYERARDAIQIGSSPTVTAGDLRDDELRTGYALALAVQHRFTLWERLRITPGLRLENFWSNRRVVRQADKDTGLGRDVDSFGSAFSTALIPGVGVSYEAAEPLTLYTGLHRGYAPPRSLDAVTSSGTNLHLDPELSWNAELGGRVRLGRWLHADLAGFLIEFENQITPPSEVAGGPISDSMFNTGHSRHLGVEASVTFDAASLFERRDFAVPLTVNYTWLPLAVFVEGVNEGNRLPYAPEHLLWVQARFAHRTGVSLQLGGTYVSEQFADKENTTAPSKDGLVGVLPGYFLLDARVAYTAAPLGLTAYLAGKNLTDQKYISNRAPSGIQPAGFRQIFAGIEGNW